MASFKRAWYGQHHHYQTGYTPLYVAEACYVLKVKIYRELSVPPEYVYQVSQLESMR